MPFILQKTIYAKNVFQTAATAMHTRKQKKTKLITNV